MEKKEDSFVYLVAMYVIDFVIGDEGFAYKIPVAGCPDEGDAWVLADHLNNCMYGYTENRYYSVSKVTLEDFMNNGITMEFI